MTRRPEHKHTPLAQTSYARGIDLYRQGRYEQAAAELASVSARSDMLGNVARFYAAMSQRAMGIEALREGRFEEAEKCLLAAAGSIGGEADLSGYLASLYAQTGRHDMCVAAMERTEQTGRADPSFYRKLAQARWRAGKRAEAYMTLTAALRELGPDSRLYVQLGLFYAAEERYDQAHEAMASAVEADCSNCDAHYHLGLVEAAQGHVQAAVRLFQRAFELRPGDLMLAYHLALAAKAGSQEGHDVVLRLPEPGRQVPSDSQIRQLARYITNEPAFIEAFLALPASAIDGELFGVLAGVVQMALDEHGDYADLNYYCSGIFHRLGRGELAIKYARRAVQTNPSYVRALLQIGRLCRQEGRDSEAIEYLRRAVACGADYPDAHLELAELMLRRKSPGPARKHLSRALELNPHYTPAAETLASMAA
ncbi:MAG: tetratricopeptide repeat protein [Phycisphaerae bacterium]|nr:tetratricopeptide repeat protein [Phycisphaerae bacterium]